MELNFTKALDRSRRVVVDLKGKKAARLNTYISGASLNGTSHLSPLKSSSLKLGKRKKPDPCRTKCRSYKLAPHRSLLHYSNFMKSGLPERLMFYRNGSWLDHDLEVIGVVREEFGNKKVAIEVKLNRHHLVFDFVRMVQFNLKTALEEPMAWIDEVGCCFFPEIFHDDDGPSFPGQQGTQEIKLKIDIEVNGLGDTNVGEYCEESSPLVKRIKLGQNALEEDSCDKVSDVRLNEHVGENEPFGRKGGCGFIKTNLFLNSEAVKKMFLEGMNTADGVDVVGICSNTGSMWQGRLELFEKQVEIISKYRGNANVRYAWLPSSKEASAGIMTYGIGHFGLKQMKSSYGNGVHLAAAGCADTSSNYCDVDENGLRYMILCRVVMGNMEVIYAGSKQFHPSNENVDSGVDDLQNPRQYVVWSMNINTHIYPEYVVSFKVPTTREGSALNADGNYCDLGVKPACEGPFNPFKVRTEVDMGSNFKSKVTSAGSKERTLSLNPVTQKVPNSPWLPFPLLLAAISKQVPASDMMVLRGHFEQFKNKAISREDFVNNLRLVVGVPLLKATITEINNKVSRINGAIVARQGTAS